MRSLYISIKLLELEPLRLSYEINPDLLARRFELVGRGYPVVILLATLASCDREYHLSHTRRQP